ncbi:hypothetical protein [Ruania alba]|uniref:ABC-2 type transport system permease protein n=1 Tax=Ruania alba TaxID=648782 RepID=A0A1H5N5B1_9MICO|nr:hypothetical protein [Ruania alba]SEE96713.1 ABC-2 type transport system permease protein [Ruania alba]
MVAHFVRLRLTLLANTFRRSVWQTIGYILAMLYALGVIGTAIVGAVAGGGTDPLLTGQVIVLVGALAILGWWIIPIFAFGVDATLDPQRFVSFGIPRRRLLTGLAAAGFTSIPGAATVLAAVGLALAWWRTPAIVPVAVIGGLLAVACCVIGSRALTTVLAPLLESRRYREVLAIVALVPIVMIGPAISTIPAYFDDGSVSAEQARVLISDVAQIAAWTPFGAPWGIAAAIHDGAWGLAGARLAIVLLTLTVLWVVWDRALARSLVTPPTAGSGGRGKGLGWFDRLPATPTGAVAARALTYWIRDPRYSSSLAVIPLLPIILVVAGGGAFSELLLIVGPLVGWILGFTISSDISFDHTAFALHVSTGTSGRADRAGRAMAIGIPGAVLVVIFAVVSIIVTDRWDLAPLVLGVSFGMLGVGLGVSSVVSARMIYPVVKPGESPLKQPQGAAMATMVAQGLGLLVVMALSLPFLVTAVLTLAVSLTFGWVTLALGVVIGAVVCVAGIRIGGRWYDRRTPEILQQVLAQA